MKSIGRIKEPEEIERVLSEAYLNLYFDEKNLFNPLANIPEDCVDHPEKFIAYLMMQPEYFQFLCQEILNIKALPFQYVILTELWKRKFPMLIGSRGLGKCTRDAWIITDSGFKKIDDIVPKDYPTNTKFFPEKDLYVLGENTFSKVEYAWANNPSETIKITTDFGYSIENTPEHKMRVIRDNQIEWIETKDIKIDDKVLINCGKEWFPVNPNNFIKPEYAYMMGLDYSHQNRYASDFPKDILSASKECVSMFICGLMDNIGYVDKEGKFLAFYSSSIYLIKTLQFMLTRFGVVSKIREFRLYSYILEISQNSVIEYKNNIGFRNKKIEKDLTLSKEAKDVCEKGYFYDKVTNIKQLYNQTYDVHIPNDHSFISNGFISHNSFLMSVYCLIRTLLLPHRKIVVCGAAFRQSKIIFEYMESIWNNAPILRDICGDTSKNGPFRQQDMFRFFVNGSVTTALPLGDGCTSPVTMLTYEDRFSQIVDEHSDSAEKNIIQRKRNVWSNGQFVETDEAYCNGLAKTKKITTASGYFIEGTYNHKIKVLSGQEIVWKRFDELVENDYVLIDRSYRWHSGKGEVSVKEAYALGLMIGDGCWTQPTKLGFATLDQELINALRDGTGYRFKQEKDLVHYSNYSKEDRANWLNRWKMCTIYSKDKYIPEPMMNASREAMSALISALYDTDGHVFVSTAKGGTSITVNFTNTSEKLVNQLQYILLHYGIISSKRSRERNIKWNTVYELIISGEDVVKFANEINFRLSRKRDKLNLAISQKIKNVSCGDVIPNVKDDMVTFSLSHKGISKCPAVMPAKLKRLKNITRNIANLFLEKYESLSDKFIDKLKELNNPSIYYDKVKSIEEGECVTYDIHVPTTHDYCASGFYSHNSKIRGQRANDIIVDEFSAMSRDVFETVIGGFGAVSANPIENVVQAAKKKLAKKMGVYEEIFELKKSIDNQIVIAGTAYYDFNHFAEYWRKWKEIIETRGDKKKLVAILNKSNKDANLDENSIPEDFKWDDYSIIRMPYEMIPEGFMDAAQVARSKASIQYGTYLNEYAAVFSTDSNGFYKRSLIEACVTNPEKPVMHPSGPVCFSAVTYGQKDKKYVYGIDPAAAEDNFAIVVLEMHPEHRRVVYCWTTNNSRQKELVAKNITNERDYYSYCARKIRELMKRFPCAGIAIDSQGGGLAIMERLNDIDKMNAGESFIWPFINPDKPSDTDSEPGLHIIDVVQFASAEWTNASNHNLKLDMENKFLLFPFFDSIEISNVSLNEISKYDTVEESFMEIEEMKNELATIIITETATGRYRWDTPEVKLPGSKKGRLTKDRYSALLMANHLARNIEYYNPPQIHSSDYGAASGRFRTISQIPYMPGEKQAMYSGNSVLSSKLNDLYS